MRIIYLCSELNLLYMGVVKKISLRETMRNMKPGDTIVVDNREALLESARVQSSILKREGIVVKVKKIAYDKYELKREK